MTRGEHRRNRLRLIGTGALAGTIRHNETDYVDEESLDERVKAIGVPLMAIFGAEEQLYEPEKALAAYAAVPGAQTALVQGAGHSPNVEKPVRTAALVLGFASRTGPLRHEVQNGVQNENPVRPRP